MNGRRLAALLACVLAVAPAACTASPLVAVVGATLLDGGGRPPLADAVVVMRGAEVIAVGTRAATGIPKGATLVDGRGRFVVAAPDDAARLDPAALAEAIRGRLAAKAPFVAVGRRTALAVLRDDPRPRTAEPRLFRVVADGRVRTPAGPRP